MSDEATTVRPWFVDGAGCLALRDREPRADDDNRVTLSADGLPVVIRGVNFGEDVEGAQMTRLLRTRWPRARAVFLDARAWFQGSDVAQFDVVIEETGDE